jgi:trehalose 6-phosphate phosphatase
MIKAKERTKTFWIFDFDGTLSEIVPNRLEAVIHPDCLKMLAELTLDDDAGVAIISSRTLEDLIHRVPLSNLTLAAGSGLEWRLANGEIGLPDSSIFKQIIETRSTILPMITPLQSAVEGVDLEDKMWSISVHYRQVPQSLRPKLRSLLAELRTVPGLKLLAGPEATEIMFLPDVNKRRGVRELLDRLRINTNETSLVYAGDDQNDAIAMRWILSRSGVSIIVGDRIRVKGAVVVRGPAELAQKIMELHLTRKQEQLFRS